MSMPRGLTAGFGGFLGPEMLDALAAWGWDMIRQGHQQGSPVLIRNLVAEIVAAGMKPVINCTTAQLAEMPEGIDVEVIDAPDPTKDGAEPSFLVTAAEYARALNAVAPIVRDRGLRAWACLTGMDKRALRWTAAVLETLDPVYGISVHRYPPGNALDWRDSFEIDRMVEATHLYDVIKGRPFAIGEFGWHQGPIQTFLDKITFRHRHRTDEQQAALIAADFAYWEKIGAAWACLYQHRDGPETCPRHPQYQAIHLAGYGIQRLDKSWKPAANQRERPHA